jgi:arylsulfatase A-like enzyme
VVAIALAVGSAWFLTEVVLLSLTDPTLDRGEPLRRGLDLLAWQLCLFALLGLALVPGIRWRNPKPVDLGWWVVGLASFAFLGVRVAEGLLRQSTAANAAVGVVAAALAIAGGLAGLRRLGRVLPASLRHAWPLAVWTGWSLLFLCYLRRAGPALGNGTTGLTGWLRFFEVEEILLSVVAAGLVLIAARGVKSVRVWLACFTLVIVAGGNAANARRAGPERPRPDVIVILIDTLRFDHVGANVGRRGLTPRLDEFAEGSVRFARAFSPGNETRLAMPGVMTSLPVRVTGRVLPEEVDSLAEQLRRGGYATFGISTNPNVSTQFGYQHGFDVFLDPTEQPDFLIVNLLQVLGMLLPGPTYGAGITTARLYYRPFAEVRRRGIRLLERSRAPSFLYLHTMDPHGPYLPPRRYLPSEFSIRDFYSYYRFNDLSGQGVLGSPGFAPHLKNLRQRYEGEVRYSDAEFGGLVRELRSLDRWDESLVWVLSDHGEAFGEHDFAGHGGPNVTRTLIQVPLLLKLPRSWGVDPRVEMGPVSTMDLLPTTLALLGETPPQGSFGRDLSRLILEGTGDEERTIVSFTYNHEAETDTVVDTYTAIRWPWKLDLDLVRQGPKIRRRLFNLEHDPEERRDLAAQEPERVSQLEEAADAWRLLEDQRRLGAEAVQIDPLLQEQLRQLGYVE